MRFFHCIAVIVSCLSLSNGLTWRGADISSVINLENTGWAYRDNDVVTPFEKIIVNHGANLARIRIWTSTSSTQYSLTYALALGKRAKAAGLALMIDLHYSDTYMFILLLCDPAHQAIPAGWPTNLAGLNTQIYTYTQSVVTAFNNQGTPITILQLGNEITDGLLWPVGRISTQGFSPASQLLHSAANGARSVSSSVKLMVHIDNGWKADTVNWFWGGIFLQGQFALADVDIMGFSFYPFYGTGATYAALKSSLQGVVTKFGKDVIVAETDWPASCSGVTMSESSVPISIAGQSTWVTGIRTVLTSLSGAHGVGIVYWEPGWNGNAGLGSSCADSLLVDSAGRTRASINMFSTSM